MAASKRNCDPNWDRLGFFGGITFIVAAAVLCMSIMIAMAVASLFYGIHEWLTDLRKRITKTEKQDTI